MYRALDQEAATDWEAFAASPLHGDPRIVPTDRVEGAPDGWSALLRHERLPFVSYPYEWPFSMLQRAALLQLDLLIASIGNASERNLHPARATGKCGGKVTVRRNRLELRVNDVV